MNLLKIWMKQKFGINYDSLTPVKQHAFKAFESFNNIAQVEIKNRVMSEAFEFVKSWVARKMLEKPDDELKEKMLIVYKDMHPLFTDVGISAEVQASEALGSVKVPRIGELGKKLDIVTIDEEKATQLLKELFK